MGGEVRAFARQDNESSEAWEAFVIFRDLGVGRSRAKVAKQLKKSEALITRWGQQHTWDRRILAWDRDIDRKGRMAQKEAIARMKTRQAKLALRAQTLIAITLEKRLESLEAGEGRILDEKTVASLLKVSTDLERLNRDQPTVIEEKREQELDYSKLSPKELEALRYLHAKLNKE